MSQSAAAAGAMCRRRNIGLPIAKNARDYVFGRII
jgi:hypothetical protein